MTGDSEVIELTEDLYKEEIPVPQMKYTIYEDNPRPWHFNWWFQKILWLDSKLARQVLSRSERGTAADMAYLRRCKSSRKGIFLGLLDWIFISSDAGKSIATRTEKVQNLIGKYLQDFADKNGGYVEILCLGCGDGMEVIKPVYNLKNNSPTIEIHATLVDIDSEAVDIGKKLAKEYGLEKELNYIQDDILNIEHLYEDLGIPKPHIVSEVGLNEYREAEDMEIWFSYYVKPIMEDDSVFITTQMKEHHGLARMAMDRTGWILIYKELKELEEVLRKSGFSILESGYDSTGLHGYAVAKRFS